MDSRQGRSPSPTSRFLGRRSGRESPRTSENPIRLILLTGIALRTWREVMITRIGLLSNMNNELYDAMNTVLDYVEKSNKKDEDREVANAAQVIGNYLATYSPDN